MNEAQAERLRQSLLDPCAAALIEIAGAKAAALVPLHERDGELFAVFTRRRRELRQHAGQISFPGGQLDPADADLLDTALREAGEEIGLRREAVTVLGALEPVTVRVSRFALYPFVGDITRPEAWVPAAIEVDEILELPLAELARTHSQRTLRRSGRKVRTPAFDAGADVIWGATARILADLLRRMQML